LAEQRYPLKICDVVLDAHDGRDYGTNL
jgi:hypothetical protein